MADILRQVGRYIVGIIVIALLPFALALGGLIVGLFLLIAAIAVAIDIAREGGEQS